MFKPDTHKMHLYWQTAHSEPPSAAAWCERCTQARRARQQHPPCSCISLSWSQSYAVPVHTMLIGVMFVRLSWCKQPGSTTLVCPKPCHSRKSQPLMNRERFPCPLPLPKASKQEREKHSPKHIPSSAELPSPCTQQDAPTRPEHQAKKHQKGSHLQRKGTETTENAPNPSESAPHYTGDREHMQGISRGFRLTALTVTTLAQPLPDPISANLCRYLNVKGISPALHQLCEPPHHTASLPNPAQVTTHTAGSYWIGSSSPHSAWRPGPPRASKGRICAQKSTCIPNLVLCPSC